MTGSASTASVSSSVSRSRSRSRSRLAELRSRERRSPPRRPERGLRSCGSSSPRRFSACSVRSTLSTSRSPPASRTASSSSERRIRRKLGTPSSAARACSSEMMGVVECQPRAPPYSPAAGSTPSAAISAGQRCGLVGHPLLRPAELGADRGRRSAGPRAASRSEGAARIASRVRRSRTSATERACSARAAITASASRSGWPATIGCRQLRALAGERRARAGRRGRSGRRAARCDLGADLDALGRLEVLVGGRHPERDVGRAAGRLAPVALDQPVDGVLRHPPPGRELAAGDREHPGGGLIELGLARDVDRLLRVAGRDQRPHAGVGAGQVAAARARCRSSR